MKILSAGFPSAVEVATYPRLLSRRYLEPDWSRGERDGIYGSGDTLSD